jgi:hypothetical protein
VITKYPECGRDNEVSEDDEAAVCNHCDAIFYYRYDDDEEDEQS